VSEDLLVAERLQLGEGIAQRDHPCFSQGLEVVVPQMAVNGWARDFGSEPVLIANNFPDRGEAIEPEMRFS